MRGGVWGGVPHDYNPVSWLDESATDEEALMDELRRTGIVQGHRPRQARTREDVLLAALVRQVIAEKDAARGIKRDLWGVVDI